MDDFSSELLTIPQRAKNYDKYILGISICVLLVQVLFLISVSVGLYIVSDQLNTTTTSGMTLLHEKESLIDEFFTLIREEIPYFYDSLNEIRKCTC